MLVRALTGLIMTVLVAGSGCRAPEPEAARPRVVATIDGVPVPLSAFENYLAVHFVEEGLEEPVPREDTDRVLSRLFDDFVAESLLVVEAERRGVEVGGAEISAWLGEEADPDPAREAGRRGQARRALAARRLLDAWIRAESKARGDGGPPAEAADDAAARLAASLRTRYEIELHTQVLSFRYVPEGGGDAVPR